MKVQELRKQLLDLGGKVKLTADCKIEYQEGKDIDVMASQGILMWVPSTIEDEEDVLKSTHMISGSLQNPEAFLAYIGYVRGTRSNDGEERADPDGPYMPAENEELGRFKGMVEAYEKIVVGRKITVEA